jgi:hypothetical protein
MILILSSCSATKGRITTRKTTSWIQELGFRCDGMRHD